MAFVDNRGLVGRPSLRRALAGLDSEQEQRFGALTADIDPRRFRSLYKQRAEDFLNNERETLARTSRVAQAEQEARNMNARRIQDFGRSPNEILGISDEDEMRRTLRRSY